MNKTLYVTFLSVMLLLSSCKTREKESEYNYLQNVEEIATDAAVQSSISSIQKGDELVIVVSAKDLDVVKPFNQNYSSGAVINNAESGGNSSASQPTTSGPTYIVDAEGFIDFPILGQINTTNMTVEDLKNELRVRISNYVISPSVAIRITNYKVTILGEVKQPGQYVISGNNTTILNALGLAGDLTVYAKRNDILLVRNDNGEITKQRIDLTDATFITSPYYQLRQGDVIYVSANKSRELTAKQNPNTGLYISVASVALGLLGLLITVFKK